ncbi:MAG: ATP-dependent helicase RhlE [Acidobacteriota bacterium]|jgi:ATP-dependent RNA helicase RhlE|nr:ATP-dependent helicase RhlE [Acidobacteriota bacterium]
MTFSNFGLKADLLQGVADMGFTQPTPIQSDAIPPAMEGRDVLACAMTGSGKTAAFLLPILNRLADQPPGVTRCLVLAPTRELAAQIHEHLVQLAGHTRMTGAAVFGGVAAGPQEQAFKTGVDVLIATPGRLLDHLAEPYGKLPGLEILVLDEADRMLDMGFLPDVRRILSQLPPGPKQTLFFSATLPPPIIELAREMLHEPVAINIERQAAPATGVQQATYPVREDLKPWLLLELLRREEIKNVLVFTRTKHRANRLADFLSRHAVSCDRIHGNRSQAQRTLALANFKNGKTRVLVATDIAARGIDVEALSHVINFDVPNVPDDYIHRVGRTARADAVGDAFTFVSQEEQGELAAIERALGGRLPRWTLAGFDYEHKPEETLEIPLAERIANLRARRAEERARAREKAERKARAAEEQARAREKRPQPGAAPRAAGPNAPGAPAGNGAQANAGQGKRQGGPRRPDAGSRSAGPRRQEGGAPRQADRNAQAPNARNDRHERHDRQGNGGPRRQDGPPRHAERHDRQGNGGPRRSDAPPNGGPRQAGPRHAAEPRRSGGPRKPPAPIGAMQPTTRIAILAPQGPAHDPDQQPLQQEAPGGFNRRPASWRRKAPALPASPLPDLDDMDDL